MHCIHVAIRPSSGCSRSGGTLAGELSTRGGSKFAEAWYGRTFLIQFPRLRPPSFFEILPSPLTLNRFNVVTIVSYQEDLQRKYFARNRVSRSSRGSSRGRCNDINLSPPPPPLFLIFPFFGHPIFQEKFSERERQ